MLGVGLSFMGLGCTMETATDGEDIGQVELALGGSSAGGTSSAARSFSNARDAQISATSPTANFGLTTGCSISGGEVTSSCLLKWDLSSIPTNAVIDAASVRFDFYDGSVAPFDIHQVNGSWQELDVNWTKRDAVSNWSSPGCNSVPSDRTSAPVATFVVAAGTRTVDLNSLGRAMIQNWVVNPAANKGIIIRNTTGTLDRLSIRSAQYSDSSRRPSMWVSYHFP